MLASVTPLPVIGVPVPLKHLDGMDSLLSIVQMPAGVPVATVSIGGARNAGLLAARILGAGDGDAAANRRARMTAFPQDLRETARRKGERPAEQLERSPGGLTGRRRLIDVVGGARAVGDAVEGRRGVLLGDENSGADPAGLVVRRGDRWGAADAVGTGGVAEGEGESAEVDDVGIIIDGEGGHSRVHELQLAGGVE